MSTSGEQQIKHHSRVGKIRGGGEDVGKSANCNCSGWSHLSCRITSQLTGQKSHESHVRGRLTKINNNFM